ncbi:MAG: hypothetical protein LC720_02600 [Actinobacteria bacterium]|nr:hypothetical protein [Actinomycetota bacterium]
MATSTAPTEAPSPAPADPGRYTGRALTTVFGALMLGMFLAALDQTIVSTALGPRRSSATSSRPGSAAGTWA